MGTINVVTETQQLLADRKQAAEMLNSQLADYKNTENMVVLGIPRGGVVVADNLARGLQGQMDVMLTRKVRAYHNPELAVGAVTEDGKIYLNDSIVSALGITKQYIENEKRHQLEEIQQRKKIYRTILKKKSISNNTVILTDDGVATGATMQAAIWAAIAEFPKKVILALPVAPPDTLKRLSKDVDETVCLCSSSEFHSISQFYTNFEQVDDEQVVDILKYYAKGTLR